MSSSERTESGRSSPKSRASPVICACADLTEARLEELLVERPSLDFDGLLKMTGAGQTCTACRLDLEYFYVSAYHNVRRMKPVARATAKPPREGLKARLFRFLDGISPPMALRLADRSPVLAANGLRECVLVSNDPLLYDRSNLAPDAEVRVVVRDAEGVVRFRDTFLVTADRPLDLDVSQFVAGHGRSDETAGVDIGSVELRRQWQQSGTRGTTRPQIVIEGPGGCGAVHTQGPNGPGTIWYTSLCRPGEERVFISVVNAARGKLTFSLTYPLDARGVDESDAVTHKLAVPPNGARLHEIVLPDETVERFANSVFAIRCEANGPHKCHILNATPNLDRFSIDHPAAN